MNILERITIREGLMGGKPTIRGMRFPVTDILELLASGMSQSDILDEHPSLELEDIKAALLFTAFQVNEDYSYE